MTRTSALCRIVRVVAVALAIAISAGPALARTFDFNAHGSLVQQPAQSTPPAASISSGGGIEWGYVAIGSSSAALALIAVGAVASGRRRARQDTRSRATTAS